MTDTTVNLDGFVFKDFEVPDSIGFGGEQSVVIHRYIGRSKRDFDAMGADEDPLEWDGIFRGADALDRAQLLNAKRKAGRALKLTWGRLAFTVVITGFKPDYTRFYEIPYRIRMEVISDDAAPDAATSEIGVDEMVLSDMTAAADLTQALRDPPLTTLMGRVDGAIKSVGSIAAAGRAQLTSILEPIVSVQSRVSQLIDSTTSVLSSVNAVGGIIPGLTNADMTGGLLAQVVAMGDNARLYDLQAIMGRVSVNLNAVGLSGSEFVTAGGDLFKIATQAYGDATEWATIAAANGLTDPVLEGVQTLLIPPTPRGSGGVLAP